MDKIGVVDADLEQELYRDYETLITLDQLISSGKLDSLESALKIPLKDFINNYYKNGHCCSDIFLDIQREVIDVI